MSDFVNFGNRGFDLPHGCKDLGDVLKLRVKEERAAGFSSSMHRHELYDGTVADVTRMVAAFCTAQSPNTFLKIYRPDGEAELSIQRTNGDISEAMFTFHDDLRTKPAVRDLWSRSKLDLPPDSKVPHSFQKDLPIYSTYAICPVIRPSAEFVEFAAELFSSALGYASGESLRFLCIDNTEVA